MFLWLFLLSLFHHFYCAPISKSINDLDASDYFLRASDDLNRTFGSRSVGDIITSCLATIFACTWTSIHPGIPHIGQSRGGFLYQRLNITGYALLCPEIILFWALHERITAEGHVQRYNAKFTQSHEDGASRVSLPGMTSEATTNIRPENLFVAYSKAILVYSRHAIGAIHNWTSTEVLPAPPGEGEVVPWTIAHGFFLEMGGFVLCDGESTRTLSGQEFMGFIDSGVIDPPSITEDDIWDRCKGDYLTKGATVIQTTWFVLQCATRWSAGLAVTELEVTTLGFAMLNSITYALWWDKPQNVGIPVYIKPTSKYQSGQANMVPESAVREEESALGIFAHIFAPQSLARKFFMQHKWRKHKNPIFMFLHLHYNIIRALLIHDSADIRENPKRFIFGGCVGILFGLVHLVPSLLQGLTLTSGLMWLWRGSALAMIVMTPIYLLLMRMFKADMYTSNLETNTSREPVVLNEKRWCMQILAMATIFCVYFKISARPVIAYLALESLRHLPQTALQTVSWVLNIPHI